MEIQRPQSRNSNEENASNQGLEDLDRIKALYDEAFLYVSQGLDYEEQNKVSFAVEMYCQGKKRIEESLGIRCDRGYCRGPKWEEARKKQQKMRTTLQDLSQRLEILNSDDSQQDYAMNSIPYERPPSYEEATTNTFVQTGTVEGHGLKLDVNAPPELGSRQNSMVVEEIFIIPDGVQIFYVSADGNVSAPSAPTSLHIYKFRDLQTPTTPNPQKPPAWLQIGDWTFPLMPGQSTALQSGYGAYFFPDVCNDTPGSSVGVILPGDSDAGIRSTFEHFMVELTLLEQEEQILPEGVEPVPYYSMRTDDRSGMARKQSTSEKISSAIVTGAGFVSTCLVKGAEVTGSLVSLGSNKLREHLTPENQPVVVNPTLQRSLSTLRGASGAARKVSGFIVNKLGEATMALGRQIAPHIKTHGTNALISSGIVSKDTVDYSNPNSKVNNVITVAAGGLQGFATVYLGLEKAARTLAYSLANETVQTVQHKYGAEAGSAVDNAVFAVGNVALTAHNVGSLGVKAVAKRTAKDTGKAMLQEYVHQKDSSTKTSDPKTGTIPEKPPKI